MKPYKEILKQKTDVINSIKREHSQYKEGYRNALEWVLDEE